MPINRITKEQIIDTISKIESLPYEYKVKPDLNRDNELNEDPRGRDIRLSSWWRYLETINLFCGERPGRVLDIGSGWGTTCKILGELGFEMAALDISNPSGIDDNCFKQCDLNRVARLPYDDESFASVVCSEVIEHIERPFTLLKEIQRILCKDGTLILTTPNILSLHSRIIFLRTSMHGKFIWKPSSNGSYHPKHGEGGHITPIDFYRMNWMLHRLGFKIEALRTNILDIPSGAKSIPFQLMNILIRFGKGNAYNRTLELGESLIVKARKA